MPRPRQPLEATYGKLTVLEELPLSMVRVRCLCGAEKSVHRSNLRAGRVLTCGADACRDTPTLKPRPRGPTWIGRELIGPMYALYSKGELGVNEAAEHYGVHPQTVYALMRTIDERGGIDAYLAGLKPVHVPEATVGGPPPPEQWIPKGPPA